MAQPIRVGLVDDHPGVRVGLRNLLARSEDIVIVGEGANGEEAIQLVEAKKPDVLLLDVELPLIRGDQVTQRLHQISPEVKILAVSSYNDPIFIQGMLENGAAGYITKEEAPHMLIEAVRSIVHDKVKWLSPMVVSAVSRITLENITLTGRELDILRQMVLGENDEEVMHNLNIEPPELEKNLEQLNNKFDVTSREDLLKAAQCILETNN